jgi:hypothetical protein
MEEEPECDPDEGNLVNTDYPNCEPSDPMDDCETCVETSCCTQSRVCYGYNPGNVCGYGGPLTGMYADLNEWDCYRFCAEIESDESGAYDDAVKETCAAECATVMCGLIGNATNELIECADTNCEEQCYTLEP